MITIQNIVGGQRRTIRSIASLGRAAINEPYGGWKIVSGTSVEGLDLDDIHAVFRAADAARRGIHVKPGVHH
ncbi:MAG: hypothetical protein HC900_06640, partial [Methylacidiphilales bacterium]|nr:hypothetical protein [Candidatus Methylacidiphilales bacterium]